MRRLLSVVIAFLIMMGFPVAAWASPADLGLPLPTVTLQVPKLVTVSVTLPPVTVTLPRATDVVTLPRVTVTGVPAPVQTVTQLQRVTITKSGTSTLTGQTVTESATINTPPQTVTRKPVTKVVDRKIRVSVPEAVGISIGLVLVGILLGLLGLAVVYRLGYADGEGKANNFLREMRLLIRRK